MEQGCHPAGFEDAGRYESKDATGAAIEAGKEPGPADWLWLRENPL
jgi:hypothetical protein